MNQLDSHTLAVEIEFALETPCGKQINYIQDQIASDFVLKMALESGDIKNFSTVKQELDACQLEITTDTYRFTSMEVADHIATQHYYLQKFVETKVSEAAGTQIFLSASSMPNELEFTPVTSLGAPHYPKIDGMLRSFGIETRRGTNVRGVHVHYGTMDLEMGVKTLNRLAMQYPCLLDEISGLYTPLRIETINSVVRALGENTNHIICNTPSAYNPGHSYMRFTKYGTLEFRQFDLGQKAQQSSDEIHEKVVRMINKVIELV